MDYYCRMTFSQTTAVKTKVALKSFPIQNCSLLFQYLILFSYTLTNNPKVIIIQLCYVHFFSFIRHRCKEGPLITAFLVLIAFIIGIRIRSPTDDNLAICQCSFHSSDPVWELCRPWAGGGIHQRNQVERRGVCVGNATNGCNDIAHG